MKKYTRFSARASLMVVGLRMRTMGIWDTLEKYVRIKQKVVRYRPIDKLLDAFILMLAGGRGLVEINTRVRPDAQLQAAFGREGCAEQSTVSATVNACTSETVVQLRQAQQAILRDHSRACDHDYAAQWQVLDVDMSGLPAGSQGEGVTKGYFSGGKKRRGRQLGRVVATWYDEIVVERLYPGNRQLHHGLRDLVDEAEKVLNLQRPERQRTLIRVDSGGGEDDQINWLLKRGYVILIKISSWQRAAKLARSVTHWMPDPRDPDRSVAWVPEPHAYHKATRQLAVRTRKQDGTWSYSVLVSNAPAALLAELGHLPMCRLPSEMDRLLAMLYAYDKRGGAAETQFKADKQGLFLGKRNKQSFVAQEMLVLLAQLAHNLLIWTREGLPDTQPALHTWGILRLVRDLLTIPGKVVLDAQGHLIQITLNQAYPWTAAFVLAFAPFLAERRIELNAGDV